MSRPSAIPFARWRRGSSTYTSQENRAGRSCSPRFGQLTETLPRNWRDRLPDCENYYREHIDRLSGPNGNGFARGLCPFHDDHNPSLIVSVTGRGLWKCFACGERGDLVRFHELVMGLPFTAAVRDLLGWDPCA